LAWSRPFGSESLEQAMRDSTTGRLMAVFGMVAFLCVVAINLWGCWPF
jgi:hypothetical protein